MVGFDISKKYLEIKYKKGLISREELNGFISKLRMNYKNGTARKELEKTGIKNYMDY